MGGRWDEVIGYCRGRIKDAEGAANAAQPAAVEERFRLARNQSHFVITDENDLLQVSRRLRNCNAYLVTVVANDERWREDGCFKIYYIFSPASDDELLEIVDGPLAASAAEPDGARDAPPRDAALAAYDDRFLIVEYLLSGGESYPSLRIDFQAVVPFEREMRDLYGLVARVPGPSGAAGDMQTERRPVEGAVLHRGVYPRGPDAAELVPLRADQHEHDLKQRADDYTALRHTQMAAASEARQSPQDTALADETGDETGDETRDESKAVEGALVMPVGPIHKDVIEAGQFRIHLAGEPIDELDVVLGYKHRGIERLFTTMSLTQGWELAERVSGDSSFAHSLAYCHAVEALAGVSVGGRPMVLRALFLELERICNHVADTAALAHDVAFNIISSEIAVLRELLMRLNYTLLDAGPGAQLLRGINEPGGIRTGLYITTQTFNRAVETSTGGRFAALGQLLEEYDALGQLLLTSHAFAERAQHVGRLRGPHRPYRYLPDPQGYPRLDPDAEKNPGQDEVSVYGATGLVARASGLRRDYRLRHPSGIYQHLPEFQASIRRALDDMIPRCVKSTDQRPGTEEMTGDVYSRTRIRLLEVAHSGRLIEQFLQLLDTLDRIHGPDDGIETKEAIKVRLKEIPPYEFAFGYVEGWRGDIVYWIMKDRFDRIFRCKVRDPSMLNWQALKASVRDDERPAHDPGLLRWRLRRKQKPLVPDFPLINKSFGLSYAGYDL